MEYSVGTYDESQRWHEIERVTVRPSRIDGVMARVARVIGDDDVYARPILPGNRLGHTTVCGCGLCP